MVRPFASQSRPISHSYSGPLKAVIFDWAGTVVDYGSRAPVEAVMRAFEGCGVPVSVDEARGPMGMAKREHIAAMLAMPRVRRAWSEARRAEPDEAAIDRIYQTFLATQTQLLADYAEIIPGCLEAVAECRQRGMKIGSSTGYTRELMDVLEPVVHRQGFKPDAMVCASDVAQGRPAPWMCLEAARRLNIFPMASIVVVDDTTVGVEAGRNAGMRTIGVARSGNLVGLSEREFAALGADEQKRRLDSAHEQLYAGGAELVIDTVADLPGALDTIERGINGAAEKASGGRSVQPAGSR
jgi:phosphonoacetaldehyde hydrolase